MSNQLEVARDIMTLAQTVQEGMEHINSLMQEDNILDTSSFFDDIVLAVTSIFKSFETLYPHLSDNRVLDLSDQLITAMEAMTTGYEQKEADKIILALHDLLPVYEAWRIELERCLRVFTAC